MVSGQRRAHERAAARFPIWVTGRESGNRLQGHTANVSMGGMLLFCAGDCDLSPGAAVSVAFGIRSEEHGGYVRYEAPDGAEVVRVERHGYGTGIAVKFCQPVLSRCAEELVLV
jgi:hypothetical protein